MLNRGARACVYPHKPIDSPTHPHPKRTGALHRWPGRGAIDPGAPSPSLVMSVRLLHTRVAPAPSHTRTDQSPAPPPSKPQDSNFAAVSRYQGFLEVIDAEWMADSLSDDGAFRLVVVGVRCLPGKARRSWHPIDHYIYTLIDATELDVPTATDLLMEEDDDNGEPTPPSWLSRVHSFNRLRTLKPFHHTPHPPKNRRGGRPQRGGRRGQGGEPRGPLDGFGPRRAAARVGCEEGREMVMVAVVWSVDRGV